MDSLIKRIPGLTNPRSRKYKQSYAPYTKNKKGC